MADTGKSNHFIYEERISAAYATFSKDLKKWSGQAGLRVEHTQVTGRQLTYDSSFSRNYAQLFPSAAIGYRASERHSLELSLSRRIRRPAYGQLNPFKFYLDPTTYREGNPYLQPEVTGSFELSHSYRQKLTTTLGYSRTSGNIIETISPLSGNPRITVQTNRNLERTEVYSLGANLATELGKWWYTNCNLNAYYAAYTGNIASTPIRSRGNLTFQLSTNNTFNISKQWSAELGGSYAAREIYGYDDINPRGHVSIGVQRKLWEGKGTLKVNVNDVFYTQKISATVQFSGYEEHFTVMRDTRVATLSFTWKFGQGSVQGVKKRQGGAEDIKQRASTG